MSINIRSRFDSSPVFTLDDLEPSDTVLLCETALLFALKLLFDTVSLPEIVPEFVADVLLPLLTVVEEFPIWIVLPPE